MAPWCAKNTATATASGLLLVLAVSFSGLLRQSADCLESNSESSRNTYKIGSSTTTALAQLHRKSRSISSDAVLTLGDQTPTPSLTAKAASQVAADAESTQRSADVGTKLAKKAKKTRKKLRKKWNKMKYKLKQKKHEAAHG